MKDTHPELDRAEEIALFRAMVVGAIASRELDRGELRRELKALSKRRFRPPRAATTRTYGVSTLERWLYAYRRGGLDALRPKRRTDHGRGRVLTPEQRQLLLDIRAEYPNASVPVILRTLDRSGALPEGEVSAQTVRRLYRQAGLPRRKPSGDAIDAARERLRWRAPHVASLWHGDVCHAMRLVDSAGGPPVTALVHAMLDDHSRYIVRLEVRSTEREQDMLEILANALREHGRPDRLYLDNGATYSGKVLALVCERLGVHLLHARPGDAPARGKMERLFRTMREQCVDHIRGAGSLHDVVVRLLAWREEYHRTPHSGLMGKTPEQVWRAGIHSAEHQRRPVTTEEQLREAYRLRSERRVRKDSTLAVDGQTYEVDATWLAGKRVTVMQSYLIREEPFVLFEGRRVALHPVQPMRNAERRRRPAKERPVPVPSTGLNPADVALDAMLGRKREETNR